MESLIEPGVKKTWKERVQELGLQHDVFPMQDGVINVGVRAVIDGVEKSVGASFREDEPMSEERAYQFIYQFIYKCLAENGPAKEVPNDRAEN